MLAVRQARRTLAAALTAVVLACSAIAADASGGGKGFIWRIERDGRVGWLVGSLHVLTPDYYPLPDAMEKAFAQADTLLEEADLREMASPDVVDLLRTRAVYSGGETLKTQLSAETYGMTVTRFERIGLPIEPFERMRPWMITLTLVAAEMKRAGFDPELGVDKYFFEKSTEQGKKFATLEKIAEQLELFAGFTPRVQEAMLRETLESLDAQMGQMQAIADAWRAGDADALERIVLEPMLDEPAFYDAMIVRRNRNWMPRVESCLDAGGCFIVVGAAHLIGPDGLLASLRRRGFTIRQD